MAATKAIPIGSNPVTEIPTISVGTINDGQAPAFTAEPALEIGQATFLPSGPVGYPIVNG
jgi:hypothetical protein